MSDFIVLLPVSAVTSLADVSELLQRRLVDLEKKCQLGLATDGELDALSAVRSVLEDEPEEPEVPDPSDEPMLLRIPEVAHMLGVCNTTVRELISRQELPCVRIGTAVRVRRDDLTVFVAGLGRGE